VPVSPEEEWEYWDKKATELRRGQLTTVQTSATKWSALLAALLGVFSAVAFAGGLTTIDKLPDLWAPIVRGITTLAVLTDIGGIAALSMAAGGLLVARRSGLTATSVQEMYTAGTGTALRWLTTGRVFALVTAVLVLAGSGIVLWAPERSDPPKAPNVLVVVNGHAVCGRLSGTPGAWKVGDEPLSGQITSMTVVASCG
jgi:hypothetical protein